MFNKIIRLLPVNLKLFDGEGGGVIVRVVKGVMCQRKTLEERRVVDKFL